MVVRRITLVMASLLLAITVSGSLSAQSDQNLLSDLLLQLQQMQEEIRELRGQVEKQTYEIENLKRRQRDQYLDLDARLADLRSGAPVSGTAPAAAVPAVPPETSSVSANPVTEDRPPLTERPDSESSVTGLNKPSAAGRSVSAGQTVDEKGMYDKAFSALKALRYTEAAQGFMVFLDKYPQSSLAGNAQYWLGESYYVTRNYDIALEAFHKLLESYPESNKVPDAWLKIGYTHYEMKDWEKARDSLLRVKEMYPDGRLARLADNRLRTMRLEGHY